MLAFLNLPIAPMPDCAPLVIERKANDSPRMLGLVAWLVLCAYTLYPARAQPFATGPRQHPPAHGEHVDARLAVEDPGRYVWVTGPTGTFRYDGSRYIPASVFGLPMGEASQIDVAGGVVWVLLEESLWRFDGERFHQFPGSFNAMAGAGDLLYVDVAAGRYIAVLGRTGTEWTVLARSTRHPRQNLIQAGEDGRIWYGAFGALAWTKWNGKTWDEGSLRTVPTVDDLRQVAPAGDGRFLTTNGHMIIPFRQTPQGTAVAKKPTPVSESRHSMEHVFASPHGTWVMVHGGMARLLPDGSVDYFRYAGPHKIHSVRAGRDVLWAAAGTAGLLAFSHSHSMEWIRPANTGMALAKAAVRLGSRLFFSRADVTYEVVPDGAEWDSGIGPPMRVPLARLFGLPASNGPYEDLTVAPDGSVWHVMPKEGAVHVSAAGQWIGTGGGPPGPKRRAYMRKIAASSDGRVWVTSRENLWEVIRQLPPNYFYREAGNWQGARHVADFVHGPDGRLFAVADGGLLQYDHGTWREEALPPCLLSAELRTAAIASPNERWFAYRNRNGFTLASRPTAQQPWQCMHFTDENGFPGSTTFLHLDRNQRLWRGTEQAVQFVALAPEGLPGTWRTIGLTEGFLDGEATPVFTEEPDGSFLAGAGNALLRIPPGLLAGSEDVPAIEGVWDAGKLRRIEGSLDVVQGAAGELLISVLSSNPAALRPLLEYRTGGSWSKLTQASIPLHTLAPGQHQLEIRYLGAARAAVLPLRVQGVWWRSPYFHAVLAAGAAWATWLLLPVWRRFAYRWEKWRYLRSRPISKQKTESGAADRHAPDWAAGTLLRGKYEIEELLATGNFSDVYAARDMRSGSAVVIKRLRLPAQAAVRPPSWLRARFLREVGVVGLIQDPGILPVLDSWFDADGTPHIVLPRVAGVTLRQFMDRNAPLSRAMTAGLLEDLANTIHAAHERGVVHCDLKPENILIPDTGPSEPLRPIVIDFGTAALHLQTDVLSETTLGAGSIRYMAPEQMLGRYSPASDVYAFASLSLELMVQASYASLDIPIDRDWEQSLRQVLADRGIAGRTADLLAAALRWDPTQRRNDIRQWTRDLLQSLAAEKEVH